jgi:hypothetical protein
VDINADSGENKSDLGAMIVASFDGYVTRDDFEAGGYGNWVEIAQNSDGSGLRTRYAHLSSVAAGIDLNNAVTQGQIIGYVGSTGDSTGPHLHFELREAGQVINLGTSESPRFFKGFVRPTAKPFLFESESRPPVVSPFEKTTSAKPGERFEFEMRGFDWDESVALTLRDAAHDSVYGVTTLTDAANDAASLRSFTLPTTPGTYYLEAVEHDRTLGPQPGDSAVNIGWANIAATGSPVSAVPLVIIVDGANPTVSEATRSLPSVAAGGALTIGWKAADNVVVHHLGLYLYRNNGQAEADRVDLQPAVAGIQNELSAAALTLANTGSYRWTVPGSLDPGTYNVKVVAFDGAGNATGRHTASFVVPAQAGGGGSQVASLTSLVGSPNPVAQGTSFTLRAAVSNPGAGDVVQFIRDTDGNGQLNTGDSILGNSDIAAGSADFSVASSSLSPGTYPYLARLRYADATFGTTINTSVVVTGQAQTPLITSLDRTPNPVIQGGTLTLQANLNDPGGTVNSVQFVWDRDGSGTVTTGDSILGNGTPIGGEGTPTRWMSPGRTGSACSDSSPAPDTLVTRYGPPRGRAASTSNRPRTPRPPSSR